MSDSKLDPLFTETDPRIQIRIKIMDRIQIRIKIMDRIRYTVYYQ